MSIMGEERTDGETDLKVHPKTQGKGLEEADVLLYWKVEEVSFFQAGILHPTAAVMLRKVA